MIPELTADEQRFRDQVCGLLCEESVRRRVTECRRQLPEGEEPELLDVYRQLGERGWLAVNWPERYGGRDGTYLQKAIVTEELIRHRVPDLANTLTIDIVGFGVLLAGTEAQKQRVLPRLASGETTAAVLFSEPGTGSDLSALQTRAEPDGDGWRLYGRKSYCMKSHISDIGLCAARTTASDVKYHGITLFLVPLQSLSVTVEPTWNLLNERFGEVTLDGVRLTADDVLGSVDDGWNTLNQVLSLERITIDFVAKARLLFDRLAGHAAKTGRLEEPEYAQRILELEARVRAAELLTWRCVRDFDNGMPDDVRSAIAKYYSTELLKELGSEAMEVVGLDAVLHGRDEQAVQEGLFESLYREGPGWTLGSGTSEIMLYLIAGSGLELL